MSDGCHCHYCRRANCVCPAEGDPIYHPGPAWVSPRGLYIPCVDGDHVRQALKEIEMARTAADLLVQSGWLKIQENDLDGPFYLFDAGRKLTNAQYETLMAFANACSGRNAERATEFAISNYKLFSRGSD